MNIREVLRVGALATVVGACGSQVPQPTQENKGVDSYRYRASFLTPGEKVISCYSNRIRVLGPEDEGGDIIMLNIFCPDRAASESLFEKNNLNGTRQSLGQVDPYKYIGLEFVDQRSTYLECGHPVPSPFQVGDVCEPTS